MKTIPTINKVAGDYKPGDLVLVAGKVGSSRTNYIIFEAVNAALNKNKVLFCSVEMSTSHVVKRIDQCLQSLNNSKEETIYGMSIYSGKKKNKVDILIRQFVNNDRFSVRLKNFIKVLDKKDKKPDAVFVDSVEMLLSFGFDSSKIYSEILEKNLMELKEIAIETQTVIFVSLQTKSFSISDENKMNEQIKNWFDFIFYVDNKGVYDFSKDNIFEITVLRAKNKDKKITLRGSFNFENLNLKFLEFNYDYDDTLHDLSNQFQGLSFVLCPKDEHKSLFLLNLAEMYSKTGKNVFIISRELVNNKNLTKMLGEEGKCITDDDVWTFEKNMGKKYFCINFPGIEGLLHYLNIKVDTIKNLDYIFIDDIDFYKTGNIEQYTAFIESLKKFVNLKNVCIIAGSDTVKVLCPNKICITDFSNSMTKALLADFVLGIRMYSPVFLQRIVKPKYNIIFSILKNRIGECGVNFFAKIDENKLNLKIIKNFSGKKNV